METYSAYIIPGLKQKYMPKRMVDIKPEDFVNATCEHLGVKLEDLQKKGRVRKHVYARQIAIYLMAMNTTISLMDMVKMFGDAITHHTTAMSGRRLIQDQVYIEDEKVVNDLERIIDIARNSSLN